jgi:hypothetical protein
MMIDDERTELRRDETPVEEATRVVDRSLEATRLPTASGPGRRTAGRDRRTAPPPAAPGAPGARAGRTAHVPGAGAEHAAYTVRRDALTTPVTRSTASAPVAVPASAPLRRRPGARAVTVIVAVLASVLVMAAAVVALVLLVTAS